MTDTLEEKVQTIDTQADSSKVNIELCDDAKHATDEVEGFIQSDTSVETTAQNITADAKVDDNPAQSVTSLSIDERAKKVVQFLQKFYRGCHGYSYFWLKNKATSDSKTLAFNIEVPEEILTQAKKALELNENDFYDAYFGVNVGNTPCSSNTRYKKDEIIEQVAIVADIDIRNPAHHKGNAENYPPNIDTACFFLPTKPTFFINSGGGCHGYWKFEKPLTIENLDDEESATLRGKFFLDVMRRRAGTFSKSIDGVHDLPRILRLPYSWNCKERDNRKMCFIIEESDNLFTPAQIDEIIESSKPVKSEVDATPSDKSKYPSTGILPNSDNPHEYESARIIEMLNTIPPSSLSDNEWLAIQSACKNLNVPFSIVDDWNKQDAERYDERGNKTRYDSLKDTSFGIETLHGLAKRFGYDEGKFRRQWYKDHPQYDTRLTKAQEYSERAGREFIPLDFFATVEKQIADAELIAENFIANIDDFSTKNIFSYEVLYSAAIVKNHCNTIGTYENFYQSCKDKKLNLSRLNKFIKSYVGEVQNFIFKINAQKNQSQADYQAANNHAADEFVYPAGYYVTDNGIEKAGMKISYAPMKITAMYRRDEDDTRLVDIWTRDTTGKDLIIERVDKGDISDARKLTALSSKGLSVTSGTSAYLVEYLAAFIDANKKLLTPKNLLNKLGWYNDELKYFVTPSDTRYRFDWERTGDFAKNLKRRGSFEKWKEVATEFMKYPVARFTLAACFAVPLLKIFNERTFSVYLMCDSKAGKSAVLRFGGSVWGSQGIVRNLRATKNGIEAELAESSDFPAIFDEKQLAENMNMTQLSYLIAQGEGKGRMEKNRTTAPRYRWGTIGILCGEEPIHEDTRTQGAITRCMSLIKEGTKIIPDDLSEIIYTEIINHHYGWAGQCFIDNLLNENFDELRTMRKQIVATLKGLKKKLVDDYYRYIATITVSDFLAQKYLFGTSDESAMESAVDNAIAITALIGTEKELSDAVREWDIISGWITENRGRILNNPALEVRNIDGVIVPPRQDSIIGKYEAGALFIIVNAFNNACKRANLNHAKVRRDLIKAGYIVPTNGETTPSLWIDNETGKSRVFQIKMAI